MFGSGTALSDNDAKLAADAAAGKLEMTEANMRALMKLADRAARKKLEIHKQVYDSYAETATPASLSAFTVTPFSSGLNKTAQSYIPIAGAKE
jgi:Zn-dependent protease with chaperone function